MRPVHFAADARFTALDTPTSLGITWSSAGVPGDDAVRAIEALEGFGELVIAPYRALHSERNI